MDEPKNTGQFGPGNPGKPKGACNKTTRTAKEAIALAAEGLGGVDRLIEWAKADPANERAFWATIYPKLIPVQVANADGEAFQTKNEWTVRFVRADAGTDAS
jgi:hypothetical protein